ncbi:hypothetical protein M514_24337, partial [Trichuris suis]
LPYKIHFSSPLTICHKKFFSCLSNKVWQASTSFFTFCGCLSLIEQICAMLKIDFVRMHRKMAEKQPLNERN